MSAKNNKLTTLVTQIRKRDLNLIYTTQRLRYADSRLRDQSDYLIFPEILDDFIFDGVLLKNIIKYEVLKVLTGEVIFTGYIDASQMFEEKWYDTNEIIDYSIRRKE